MRRFALSLIAITIMRSSAALADIVVMADPQPRRHMFLIDAGNLFNGILAFEYERGVAPWLGVNFGLGSTILSSAFNDDDYSIGLNSELGFRFHFIRHAPAGLWFGPYATMGVVFEEAFYRWWTWGVGAAAGYNFIFGRYFTLQLGGGGGFVSYGDHTSWDPRLKIGLGASW